MLTLLRGKSKKSEYMRILHMGTNNSLMILYGHDIPISLPDEKKCWIIDRRESAKTDSERLKGELLLLMENVMSETEYRNVFLYGNFDPQEASILEDVAQKIDDRLSIAASVHDVSVPDGQIIIEEIR